MTNAVYLIIAGALLGPIESKAASDQPMGCLVYDSSRPTGAILPPCPPPTYEPHAETCERAMKEIGAEYTFRAPTLSEQMRGYSGFMERQVNGAKVLCIPAPSGLKR